MASYTGKNEEMQSQEIWDDAWLTMWDKDGNVTPEAKKDIEMFLEGIKTDETAEQ